MEEKFELKRKTLHLTVLKLVLKILIASKDPTEDLLMEEFLKLTYLMVQIRKPSVMCLIQKKGSKK